MMKKRKMTISMNDLIFRDAGSKILTLLLRKGQYNKLAIAKDTDITYNWVVRILHEFSVAGLVTMKKNGREQFVELTDTGASISRDIRRAMNKLSLIE